LQAVEGPDPASLLIRLERETPEPFQGIKPGQILVGKIVGKDPQGYVVSFRGRSFLLRTTGSFQEGQEVRAELVEQDGTFYLRPILAGSQAPSGSSDAGLSLDHRVKAILAQLGLEATPENAAAASELILAGLPLSHGLLESLSLLLSGKVPLEAQLVQLTQLLRDLLPRLGDPRLSDPLREILAILQDAAKTPEEADLAGRLRSFLADSGIFAEAKIRMALESGADARRQIATDLKFVLLRLKSLVAAGSKTLRHAVGGRTFRQLELAVANALKLVRGQQAQNLILAEMNQLLFHVPFLRDWGFDRVRVRFLHEEEASKGKPPRPPAILVEMSATNLGPLRVVLRLYRGRLYCHFTAEREGAAKLIRAESSELREHLETLSLNVGGITCRVGKCDPATTVPSLQTVDVKV
jgi:hypothetical protein